MAAANPVGEALVLLEQRQASLRSELAQVDQAVSALRKLVGKGRQSGQADPNRPSVRTKVVRLLEEEPRDWSAGEIIAEYQRREDPIQGRDPSNALRAALADAKKKNMVASTGTGRYKASKWAVSADGSSLQPRSEEVAMSG